MNRKIACITLDVEADFHDPNGRIRLFDDETLLKRYVSIINERGVKVTAFLVTSLLNQYGAAYKRLSEQIPVEFSVHSHMHNLHDPCSRRDIETAVAAFRTFTGNDPAGYRAPAGQITREGLNTLFDLGLRYDSSIYPSFRPGMPGYNNLHLPVAPFRITRDAQSIIEVPFATLSGGRLVFSLSYVKLFGWRTYSVLMKLFPLPDQVSVLVHPYDLYFHLLTHKMTAIEKPLLGRNAEKAFDLFETMITFLHDQGFEFNFMSGLCDYVEASSLPVYDIDKVIR